MRKVILIQWVGKHTSKDGRDYTISHVLLDDGTEAEYFGEDVGVDDEVEVFLHWGKIKARKKPH